MLNRGTQFILSVIGVILVGIILIYCLSFATYADEPFKVKLNLFERLICMTLWPPEGSFTTLKIVRDMQMELAPTEEEIKLAGIKDDLLTGGVLAEDWTAVEDKEIVFGDVAKALIVGALEKLDGEEKLTQQHFSLYEKFVLEKKEEVKEGE